MRAFDIGCWVSSQVAKKVEEKYEMMVSSGGGREENWNVI
jgi:hypothetical protein